MAFIERSEFVEYMQAFEQRINQRMDFQFEETRSVIRLSFEAVEALRETTEHGFADMRTDHEEQISLLHTALKHVRRRVEAIERRD